MHYSRNIISSFIFIVLGLSSAAVYAAIPQSVINEYIQAGRIEKVPTGRGGYSYVGELKYLVCLSQHKPLKQCN